ncbi:hypothetical protein CRG98_041755, partial [Punica granatum]
MPFEHVPATFLHRPHSGLSPSGTSRLLFYSWVIPFGYVPTTFLHRGHPLRVRPDYFAAQGSSPWGTSRLLFCTGCLGVCPLRVRPNLLFCIRVIPFGYVPTTSLHRGHPLRVRPDYFAAQGSSPW